MQPTQVEAEGATCATETAGAWFDAQPATLAITIKEMPTEKQTLISQLPFELMHRRTNLSHATAHQKNEGHTGPTGWISVDWHSLVGAIKITDHPHDQTLKIHAKFTGRGFNATPSLNSPQLGV